MREPLRLWLSAVRGRRIERRLVDFAILGELNCRQR